MKIIKVVFFLVICSINVSYADNQRTQTRFTSKNDMYSLEIGKGNWWRLKTSKGKVVYKIKDQGFTSMTILVSNDGQKLVVVDDFAEGHSIKNRNALWFYNEGELVRTYKLCELLDDTCNVALTIWHTIWAIQKFKMLNTDSVFYLPTFEMYDYRFDTINGNILSKQRPVNFDAIVYGTFTKGEKDTVSMKVVKHIAGRIRDDSIIFKTKFYGIGRWTRMVIIKDGEDVTPSDYREGYISVDICKE